LTKRLRDIDNIKREEIFGLFPEFRSFVNRALLRQAAADLRRFDKASAIEMTMTIPTEWEVGIEVREALVDLIVGRAAFVADTIEDRLCWRRGLFADTEETERLS